MSTSPDDIQAGNLRRYADRELTVRIDGDRFTTSKNNAFSRLVVWAHADLLPAIRTRRVSEARERFIAAVGNRADPEGDAAAGDDSGVRSTKSLRSRDARRASGRPVREELGRPPPAQPESAARRPGMPHPGAPYGRELATPGAIGPAANGPSAASPIAPQGPPPAGETFYRESQEAGTDLSGMHALNAFFGGPVIGADGYKGMSIDVTLDMLGVSGVARDDSQTLLPSDAPYDGRPNPDTACTHAAVETGVTIPDAAHDPQAHAQARARINAFPGDRLIAGYSRGDAGDAHMIALRREEDGHWQILDSLEESLAPPMRAASLADCLDMLPGNLLIVHLDERFSFRESVAASHPTGAAALPGDSTTPVASETEATETPESQQTDVESSPTPLPTPVRAESESRRIPTHERVSPTEPSDNPPRAAAEPVDPVAMELRGGARADARRAPDPSTGIAPDDAQPLLDAGVPPEEAALLLEQIRGKGDDPHEVLRSGIPVDELRAVYRHGYGLREARLLHFDANLPAVVLDTVYGPHRLRLTPDTLIRYTERNVVRPAARLGGSPFHTVYFVRHDDGVIRVFKPLDAPDPNLQDPVEHGWTAYTTGIDLRNPQVAMRNIMTCRLAEELGFNVVVETELGLHRRPNAAAPELGLVMAFARGWPANSYVRSNPLVFELLDVRRELTKLQLLDCLTAQGDRHIRNYFVEVRADGDVRVAGIDNDQCFGMLVHDPDAIRRGQRGTAGSGFRSCGLPPVIDSDMGVALLRLTPERVRELLADRLLPEEIEATVHRLDAIKDHIVHLDQARRIVTPHGWGDPVVEESASFHNSYYARDSAWGAGLAAFGGFQAATDAMGFS